MSAIAENQIEMRILLRNCGIIDPESIEEYIGREGYIALRHALSSEKPRQVIEIIKASGLRGRGGAGFPTGLKWELAEKAEGEPKYLICNADEGEPGTYKDRILLEGDPHSVIEGMVIAAYAIGASQGYLYIRGEYGGSAEIMDKAIGAAKREGYLGEDILGTGFSFDISIRSGAGSYVCGEETALMESIEGRRGESRIKPPYPTESGLWGRPTVINNVETLANIPPIIKRGSSWYRGIGTAKSPGTRLFALSGDIQRRGVVELPMGTTLRSLIYEAGGGIPRGRRLKMAQIGGSSGGFLPSSMLDIRLDFESLAEAGASLGSGAVMIIDDSHSIFDVLANTMSFFEEESCGKCTPCREGTHRLKELIGKIRDGRGTEADLDVLKRLSGVMERSSMCGLGQAAPKAVISSLRYFGDEYLERLRSDVVLRRVM